MTIRATLLGLLGATLLGLFTFFNDMVMRGTFLVGNFLPITVFGGLILFLMLVNPLLARLGRQAPLTGRELSVIVALMLFACYVPGRGLMHQFTTFLMLPHHYTRTTPGWQGEPTRITAEQVKDWSGVVTRLAELQGDGQSPGELIAAYLPQETQQAVREAADAGSVSDPTKQKVLQGLNAMVNDPEFAAAAADNPPELPTYARGLCDEVRADGSSHAAQELARAAVDASLAPFIAPRQPAVTTHPPDAMLANPDASVPNWLPFIGGREVSETVALDGFVNGLGTGDESIGLREVPWLAWGRTLLFWIPVILSVCIAATGLALVIHRQWATHERLPYPTIEFATSLLPPPDGTRSSIFQNRLFWLGTAAVFLLHMNNYAYRWWPELLVPVRTRFNFSPLLEVFPIFRQSGVGIWPMFNPAIYFTVIGFAYFLSTDVSLSLGIAPYVYAVFTGLLAGYGISVNGAMLQPHISNFFYAGAYCGMFLVLVYTGRRYYSSVMGQAVGLRQGDVVERSSVWGARVFLIAIALFVVQLAAVGLSVPLGLLYALVMVVLFVVISRLLAEAGVFYLHAYFFPCAVLWGFAGAKALGPDQLLIMGMLSSVLLIDPREAFMPYAVSGLKLTDEAKCKLGRVAGLGVVALLLGIAAAVPATLYLQYQHGAIKAGDGWTTRSVPQFAFKATSQVRKTLAAQGALRSVDNRSGLQRLVEARPKTASVIGFFFMFSLVIVFTVCRHRFAWWPLHPLLFLVLATWQSRVLAFSFLIGWLVKKLVTKYGGAQHYVKIKPLMIGLVTGEMLAGIIPMIIGAIYYAVTGEPPKSFAIYR